MALQVLSAKTLTINFSILDLIGFMETQWVGNFKDFFMVKGSALNPFAAGPTFRVEGVDWRKFLDYNQQYRLRIQISKYRKFY